MMDGWRWREKHARERDAWMLANQLQPHSKKRLRPAMFLMDDREKDPAKLWQSVVDRKVKAGEWH
jgi:hypothetical protein